MGVLVVTGGSRGIGAEICRLAAADGWSVAVNCSSSLDEAERVAAEIRTAGSKAITVQADVSEREQVEAMFAQVDKDLGAVTGLVNNAGVNGPGGRVEDLDAEAATKMFAINVLGCFLCSGAAIRRMAKRFGGEGGSIVNVSSAASRHGGPGSYVAYAASKGAVDTFTVGLAKEQAAEGIRVNCLRPGIAMTELSIQFAEEHPEWEDWVIAQVPLERAGQVDEIAKGVYFLLSDDASYITGAILDACGGWVSP